MHIRILDSSKRCNIPLTRNVMTKGESVRATTQWQSQHNTHRPRHQFPVHTEKNSRAIFASEWLLLLLLLCFPPASYV